MHVFSGYVRNKKIFRYLDESFKRGLQKIEDMVEAKIRGGIEVEVNVIVEIFLQRVSTMEGLNYGLGGVVVESNNL